LRYNSPVTRLLLLFPLLLACGNPAELTIHNGLAVEVQITGLNTGPLKLDAGQSYSFDEHSSSLTLLAKSEVGSHKADLAAPPPGGQALWVIGGGACFALADYSSYYRAPLDSQPAVRVVQLLGEDTATWLSSGTVASAPGQRLPEAMRDDEVLALVRVPCEVAQSEAVARGWLEMTLDDLQPSRAAKSQ
jgi:hypothetical protein